MNSIKFSEEPSQSWLLALEALVVGIFLGYQTNAAGAGDALSFALGVAATAGFYALVVLITPAFWIWTVAIGAVAAYFVHKWLSESGVGSDWSIVWTILAFLAVLGIHAKARLHSYAEDFGPRVTRIKPRN